jgi:DNA helicase-4
MSKLDFTDLFNQLLDIDNRLRLLRRKEKLRNRLKILGIGFLIYKNVQKEIEELLSRRQGLLENLVPSTSGHMDSLRKEVESIRNSDAYLSREDESDLLNRLIESKKGIEYLNLASVLEKSQAVGLLAELDGFHHFVENYNAELEKNRLKQKLLLLKSEILQSEEEFNSLCCGQVYFSKRDLHDWKNKWSDLVEEIEKIREKAGSDVDFQDSIERVIGAYREGDNWLKVHNTEFTIKEMEEFSDYFEKVEKEPLTQEQRKGIVTEEINNLIVAGAGTGKTSTIVGKAGYLIRKGLAKPEEILLLSFNRAVSQELQERVALRLNTNLHVHTYHNFGLEVIAKATGTRPSVSELAEDRVKFSKEIHKFIKNRMKDPVFAELIQEFSLYYFTPYRSAFEFHSFGEYVEYIKQVELRSLKGEKVKSFEECFIANFLYINGIEYVYEKPYEVKTVDINHRQYKPDFFLPKYRLYIEHFGISREGKTAPFVAQNQYKQQMQWKRDIHTKHQTTLLQTFSYEHEEGTLLKNLEKNLREKGVVFNPMAKEQILSELEELGRINQLSRLIADFLNLYKSSGKGIAEITDALSADDTRTRKFLRIFSCVYEDYVSFLKEVGEIDFNDMLNEATKFILSGEYESSFKYILVDEFQDISYSRYLFLKSLLDQNKSRLFAVGDDWQSIYRFTGSDVSLMVDFEENFGFSERCFLQESFRLNDKLCQFSTRFVLQNPMQIKKDIKGTLSKNEPAVTIVRGRTRAKIREILEAISKTSNKTRSVFVIGRYNRLKKEYFDDLPRLPYLDVQYTTAHRSKGREADYVILIGVAGGTLGFPCQIVDDPILDIVLAKREPFPNAEERRLFYVALTRARKHVYLIDDPKFVNSPFISEILKGGYETISTGQPLKTALCPTCETGEIIAKDGKYGRFFQCSNYPYCDYTPEECPRCRNGYLRRGKMIVKCSNDSCSFSADICPLCSDGYLVKRTSSRSGGYFFGCVNYPECRYIRRIDSSRQYMR